MDLGDFSGSVASYDSAEVEDEGFQWQEIAAMEAYNLHQQYHPPPPNIEEVAEV